MRIRRTGLVLISVSALALAACGGGSDDTNGDPGQSAGTEQTSVFTGSPSGDLSAWGFENADDVGTSRLDYAAEQLPDLSIEIDQTAFDTQKFTTRLASGDVPDVVQMDRREVTTFASQNLIMPLSECYAANDVDPDERYYSFVMDDVRYKDDVWGVPQFYQPPAVLLNQRVLDEAGVTPEEMDTSKPDVLLAAIAKMYQEEGGVPSRLGLDPNAGEPALWILGNGGQFTDEDGVPTLDDPSNIAGLQLMKDIYDAQGGYAKVKSFTDSFDFFGAQNQFVADQVGAQIVAQWYPNVLADYKADVSLYTVPFRGSDGDPFSVASGTSFVIPAGAKNPDAACAWMLNLTSTEAWNAAGEARAATVEEAGKLNTGLFTGSPEADKAIREAYVVPTGEEGFDQTINTFYEVLDYGQSFGSSPAGLEIRNELNNAVTSALLEEKSPEEAMADAQVAAQRAYDSMVG